MTQFERTLEVLFLVLFILDGIFVVICTTNGIGNKYNLFLIPINLSKFLINVIFGKKYIVKINGTWTIARGKKRKSGQLFVLYGNDCHEWLLQEDEWSVIKVNWSEKQIQDEVIKRNITDLQEKNPLKIQNDDNGPTLIMEHTTQPFNIDFDF